MTQCVCLVHGVIPFIGQSYATSIAFMVKKLNPCCEANVFISIIRSFSKLVSTCLIHTAITYFAGSTLANLMLTRLWPHKLPEFIILFISHLWCISIPVGATQLSGHIVCCAVISPDSIKFYSSDMWSTAVKTGKHTVSRFLNVLIAQNWYVYCDVSG